MTAYEGVGGDHPQGITRRNALVAGTGLGAAALSLASSPGALAAEDKRGGHLVVLNYAYPEVWDPHIAGTLGALGSISPVYNQVVEFNPLKPDEVIGDLAKSWDVEDSGLTYISPAPRGEVDGWQRPHGR